jgi:hypothetical protein
MESAEITFLDELRGQILVAAREGRDRQARAPRAWAKRHVLLLATVAALVVASAAGAGLLSLMHGGSRHGTPSTHGVAAPNTHVLVPAPQRGGLGLPAPPSVGDQLFSIVAAGPNDVWAVGERDYVTNGVPSGASLIEHWDGHRWSVVSCPNIGWLVSVAALAADDVWAIAQGTGLGRQALHWDGTVWQAVAGASLMRSHGAGRVTLVAGRSTDAWAIGWGRAAAGGKWGPLAVHWDGVSWKRVPSPGVLARKHHSTPVSLAVLGPNNVWAVGSRTIVLRSSHHKARRPFIEHWNGKAWSAVAAPSIGKGGIGLAQIAASPDGGLWAVGGADTPPGSWPPAVVMRWDAKEWKILKLPKVVDAGLTCISALGRSDVWVGGSYGPVMAHWNGSSWRVFHRAELGLAGTRAGAFIDAVTASTADDVWAVSYNGDYVPSPDGSVAQTEPVILHWDGTRWSRSSPAPYQAP